MRVLGSIPKKDTGFWFIVLIGILVFLPILAPILMSIGLESLARPLYFTYSFFCHQFHTRSLFIADFQYAWCARDFGIWLGIFISSIAVRKNYISPISLFWIPLFIIPIALDGGVQTIATFQNLNSDGSLNAVPTYISNNFIRFITGALFGVGIGIYMYPFIQRVKDLNAIKRILTFGKEKTSSIHFKNLFKIGSLLVILIVIYAGAIATWRATSFEINPTNSLDSIPKITTEQLYIRRKFGACPSEGVGEVFSFSCIN